MKKIGILFGQERSFPMAFIERINSKNVEGIVAEPVRIDKVVQGDSGDYAVIVDRISQDVPFYRAFLKNAAISGTAVINNPFWWSADEKFFNNALAVKIGVPIPKTVILLHVKYLQILLTCRSATWLILSTGKVFLIM
jgi:glutathione synthase/RimK-type ligase-like ATP-grasp enzyme